MYKMLRKRYYPDWIHIYPANPTYPYEGVEIGGHKGVIRIWSAFNGNERPIALMPHSAGIYALTLHNSSMRFKPQRFSIYTLPEGSYFELQTHPRFPQSATLYWRTPDGGWADIVSIDLSPYGVEYGLVVGEVTGGEVLKVMKKAPVARQMWVARR